MLGTAIKLAAIGHFEQWDKSGKPYILHPLHLMTQFLWDEDLAIIAVLHDVLEDTDMGFEELKGVGFNKRVLAALLLLTHDKRDDYLTVYIPKICTNYDAIRIKRKDIEHNSDITRLKGLRDKDFRRLEKYHKAFTILGEAKLNF